MTSSRSTLVVSPQTREKLACVRAAFKSQRHARSKQRLWSFYVEHNLIQEAANTRALMLEHLKEACALWKSALGLGVPTPRIEPHALLTF